MTTILRRIFRDHLTLLAALVAPLVACTVDMHRPSDEAPEPSKPHRADCPIYGEPACPDGEPVRYSRDEAGCAVPACTTSCPLYAKPECGAGTELSYDEDDSGCQMPVCRPLDCPIYAEPACGESEQLEWMEGDDGCPTPQCLPVCPLYGKPACPDGARLEWERDETGCQNPVCIPDDGCAARGCSGERCSEAGDVADDAGTCEWLPEYACYQDVGVCERQADGTCGFTPSDELKACLADPPVDA